MTSAGQPAWDGRGLPPSATARMSRTRASGLTTSMLSIGGGLGLESVGFVPVSEVMGSSVVQLGWIGFGGCGYGGYGLGFGAGRYGPATTVTSRTSTYGAYTPYVRALEYGYAAALGRMVAEAQQLGAHGVVDVQLNVRHLSGGAREFVALGTAVRGLIPAGSPVPTAPFTTQLSGADVTKALRSGWAPVSIVVAISVGLRHDDLYSRRQFMTWSNVEMDGYTELVTMVRNESREIFADHVGASGATRAYVTSLNLHIWSIEPSDGHRDHVAESVMIGGGLIDFAHGSHPVASASTITVMPLSDPRRTP